MAWNLNFKGSKDAQEHYCGKFNNSCKFCEALFWLPEKIKKSSIKNPSFGSCCNRGAIKIPKLSDPPEPLKFIFT